MKRAACLFLSLLLVFENVYAATPDAFSGRINNMIGSIINGKSVLPVGPERDAAFQRTMAGIKAGVTDTAAAIVIGGAAVSIGAVSWPMFLASTAVSGVVGSVVNLGVNNLVQWIWPDATHPKQVKLAGTGMGTGDSTKLTLVPSTYLEYLNSYGNGTQDYAAGIGFPYHSDNYFASDVSYSKTRHMRIINLKCDYVYAPLPFCDSRLLTQWVGNIDLTFSSVNTGTVPGVNGYWKLQYSRQVAPLYYFQWVFEFVPPTGTLVLPPSYSSHWLSPSQAANDLPEIQKTNPLSDALLAQLVNALWKMNSKLDSQQYDPANPVNSSDISRWRAANPTLLPTIGDFISPIAPAGVSEVPIPDPLVDPVALPIPGTTPSPVSLDFGIFTAPTIDATPAVADILDPIFNMFPEWTIWRVPAHTSTCPTPSFDAFGHHYVFNQMCDLITEIYIPLQLVFSVMWGFTVFFIIIGA